MCLTNDLLKYSRYFCNHMSINPKYVNGLEKSLFCINCQFKNRIDHLGIYGNTDGKFFAIVKCYDCDKLSFLEYGNASHGSSSGYTLSDGSVPVKLLRVYPSAVESNSKDVPPKITKSYLEGIVCLESNAPNGAVALFRRALQQICIDLGASEDDRLEDQVKKLPDVIRPNATEIRKYGNFGVHEDKRGIIIDVTIPQAKSIKLFLERIFLEIYQHPAQLKRLKDERM